MPRSRVRRGSPFPLLHHRGEGVLRRLGVLHQVFPDLVPFEGLEPANEAAIEDEFRRARSHGFERGGRGHRSRGRGVGSK
jgi:hypothetical protein